MKLAILPLVILGLSSCALLNFTSEQDNKGPQAPYEINGRENGVGSQVADFQLKSIDGKAVSLRSLAKSSKAVVLVFTSTSCPLTKLYGPSVARLEDAYSKKGVKFVFINPAATDSKEDALAMIKAQGFDGPYVRDPKLVAALGAKTTTEVFVLDSARTLQYRGAVDDQYGIGYSRSAPRTQYLVNALDAVLSGERPRVTATWAPGCVLEAGPALPAKREAVNFSKHVSRVLQANCVSCHRAGGVAPFRLDNFADAKDRAPMLKFAVEKGIMPPWFAAKTKAHESPWKNDRSLTDEERATLTEWVANGMPEGDKADLPLPLKVTTEWEMGTPDAIYQLPKPIQVQADGYMEYVEVEVDPQLDSEKWAQAIEVLPTAGQVVHHVLVFAEPRLKPGERRKLSFDGLRTFFGAYVPGNHGLFYPEGYAKRLPKDSILRFQIHYTPNGTATQDQCRIGVKWATTLPRYEIKTTSIFNIGIRIPPNDGNHMEKGWMALPVDAKIWSFMPHMHLRGKAFKYEVVYDAERRETLLDVPRFDFNWQLKYDLKKPLFLPKGTKIEAFAWFDNSTNNPANPNPNKTVFFGDQTYDEMMIGYMDYTTPGEPVPGSAPLADESE